MDLINRQDAIDAIRECGICEQRILDVPSAESEIIRCKDCKHYHTFANGMSVSWCDLGYSREIDIYDEWFCGDAKRRTDE